MSEKNIGKLHVEISGDSSKLKDAAKQGTESLKDIERTAKNADGGSSFNNLKTSLSMIRSQTDMMVNSMRTGFGSIKAAASSTSENIKYKFGSLKYLNMPIEEFQKSLNKMSAGNITKVLDVTKGRLSSVEAEMAKVESKYNNMFLSGGDKGELSKLQKQFAFLKVDATEYKAKIESANKALAQMKSSPLKNVQNDLKNTAKEASKMGQSISKNSSFSTRSLTRMAATLLGVRSAFSLLTRSVREYISNDDHLNATLQGASMSLGQALSPAIDAAIHGFATLVKWIMTAIQYFMTFVNVVFGTNLAFGKATKGAKKTAGAISGVGKAAKEANKSVAGFDDLNIKSTQDTSSGGGGGGGGAGGIEPIAIEIDDSGLSVFAKQVKKYSDMFIKNLQPFIDTIKSIDFTPVAKSFAKMWGAMKPILGTLGDMFFYTMNNMVAPFFKWFIEKFAPAGLDVITAALRVLSPVLQAVSNVGKFLWETFLEPVAAWTGGIIISVLQGMAEWLGKIGEWMTEHMPIVEGAVVVLASFATALGLVTGALKLKAAAFALASGAGKVFAGVMAFVTGPIGGVVLAITAVIAIGALLVKHWDEISAWWAVTWSGIKQIIDDKVQAINSKIQQMKDWFTDKFQGIKDVWDAAMDGIYEQAIGKFNAIRGFVGGVMSAIGGFFVGIGTTWFNIIGGMLKPVIDILGKIKGIFKGLIEFIAGAFTGDWSRAWKGVTTIFENIMGGIGAIFKAPLNVIIGGINGFMSGLNKIKVPNWVPGVGGKGFHFEPFSYLASGATVKATSGGSHTIVGEGKYDEAVIPLGQSPQFRGMKSDIAQQVIEGLSEMGFGGNDDQEIVFQVDGDTFAKVAIKQINKRTMKLQRSELVI